MSPHHRTPPERFPRTAALRQTLSRNAVRPERIRLRAGDGQPHLIGPDDPRADALVEAANGLISASQRASRAK